MALQQRLQQTLLAAGLPSDTRPYRPHLTLARQSRLPAQTEPCAFAWQVKRLVLFASQQEAAGKRYHALGEWPLQP
ncbi:RNA 2',3'-cyclic phosphodiesterase [compost metagenome]